MNKLEFVKEVGRSIDRLANVINLAGMQSAMQEGHYHHPIAHGIVKAMFFVSSGYNRFKESYQQDQSLPLAELGTLQTRAEEALETDLTGAILHYGRAITERAGQEMTDEDLRVMEPLRQIKDNFIPAYNAFRRSIN